MTEEHFTNALRDFAKRKPFTPFVVDMLDGRRILIDQPFVVFGGGVAGYVSDEQGLIDFSCAEVRAITLATTETTA